MHDSGEEGSTPVDQDTQIKYAADLISHQPRIPCTS